MASIGHRRFWVAAVVLASLGCAALGVRVLDTRVAAGFEAAVRSAPSRLLSRPFVVHEGLDPLQDGIGEHLERTGYRQVSGPEVRSGEWAVGARAWTIGARGFATVQGYEPARTVVLDLDAEGRVEAVRAASGRLEMAPLEPWEIGAFVAADGRDRRPVPLDEVPEALRDAMLVAEDRRFFEHAGVDVRRTVGAFVANLRAGRIVQGGSTLTQQLAKSLFLSRERTYGRKLRELVIAWSLERQFSKEAIFEAYLNEIYLGQAGDIAVHGVGQAARHYFGRDIGDLDLAQCALLAGIVRSPSSHSPLRSPEAARARRDAVLDQMRAHGRVGPGAHDAARNAPLVLRPDSAPIASSGYFMEFVRRELSAELGREAIEEGGLRIMSTLDPRLQLTVERSVRRRIEELEARSPELRTGTPLQAAVVVLEPRTGQLLAHVGGRDFATSPFDRATSARRQPGSVFKPIVVLTALARGTGGEAPPFTLASVLEDRPLSIRMPSEHWNPSNHDRRFRGLVTVRDALERSMNVPMVRLGLALGSPRVIATARRLGVESPLEPNPTLPLGSFEVTLLEMTRAYAVLAAGGVRAPLRSVLGVRTGRGEPVALARTPSLRVFAPEETYLLTSALQGAVDRGTSTNLRRLGYRGAVAGKTGSTSGFRDAWFMAYTPEIVVGSWMGFDFDRRLGLPGSQSALPLVADVLIHAIGSRGGRHFRPPQALQRAHVARSTAGRCRRRVEWFLAGTVPESTCTPSEDPAAVPSARSGGADPVPKLGAAGELE